MLALILLGSIDFAELRGLRIAVGIVVLGRVREVEAFDTQSKRHPFANAELAMKRRIDVDDTGALNDIATGIAEGVLGGDGEGARIEELLAGAGIAQVADGSNPVGTIGVAGRVDDAGDAGREPSAGHDAGKALELPTAEDPLGRAGPGKAFAFAEGKVPHVALGEDVGSVVVHAAFVQGYVNRDRQAAVVFGIVQAFAEGVGGREEQAIADAPVELHLEAVVPGVGADDGVGIGDAPEGSKERPTVVAGAGDH